MIPGENRVSSPDDSLLDDLIKLIPGYGAYRGQEDRRADDRQARKFVAQRLGDCKSSLDRCGAAAVKQAKLDMVAEIEEARDQVQRAQSRVSAAVAGYASWFGEKQVDEKLLKQVVQCDQELVSVVDRVDAFARQAADSLDAWDAPSLAKLLAELHLSIDRRNALL